MGLNLLLVPSRDRLIPRGDVDRHPDRSRGKGYHASEFSEHNKRQQASLGNLVSGGGTRVGKMQGIGSFG